MLKLVESWSLGITSQFMAFGFELSLTKAVLLALGIEKHCIEANMECNQGESISVSPSYNFEIDILCCSTFETGSSRRGKACFFYQSPSSVPRNARWGSCFWIDGKRSRAEI